MSTNVADLKVPALPQDSPADSKNLEAAELLESWLKADDGYDARVWSVLERALQEDRFRLRDNHDPTA